VVDKSSSVEDEKENFIVVISTLAKHGGNSKDFANSLME